MNKADAHFVFRKASSEETSQKDLSELAKSDDVLIACAVASNKTTSQETLEALQAAGDPDVLDCLRKRGFALGQGAEGAAH